MISPTEVPVFLTSIKPFRFDLKKIEEKSKQNSWLENYLFSSLKIITPLRLIKYEPIFFKLFNINPTSACGHSQMGGVYQVLHARLVPVGNSFGFRLAPGTL